MAERFANWWRNLARDGLPPNSISAYVFALALIAVSAMIHGFFAVFGGNVLPFTAYYPATLLTSLVAGAGPGVFSILLSLAIVLWAFPTPAALAGANVALFLLCSAATVGVAELYRSASRRLHEEERKRALLMRELEHRGKNTFAIVQSIVARPCKTERTSPTPSSAGSNPSPPRTTSSPDPIIRPRDCTPFWRANSILTTARASSCAVRMCSWSRSWRAPSP